MTRNAATYNFVDTRHCMLLQLLCQCEPLQREMEMNYSKDFDLNSNFA